MTEPGETQALEATLRTLIRDGRHAQAEALLVKLCRDRPSDPEPLRWLLQLYLATGQRAKTPDLYRHLREADPEDPTPCFGLATQAAGEAGLDEAEALMAEAERLAEAGRPFPPQLAANACLALAVAHDHGGRFDAARAWRSRALDLAPDSFRARRTLYDEWLAAGDLSRAAAVMNEALLRTQAPEERREAAARVDMCQWGERALAEMAEDPRPAAWRARSTRPRIVLAQTVWGESFVEVFRRHLRTLLAPGNLPALAATMDVTMVLATPDSTLEKLRRSGILEAFDGLMDLVVVPIPESLFHGPGQSLPTAIGYHLYAIGLHLGVVFAQQAGAAVSLLTADHILADGALGLIAEKAAAGCTGVLATGMVCRTEGFLAALRPCDPAPEGPLALAPRRMTELAVDHLHPYVTKAIVTPENRDFDHTPGTLFWYSADGLAAHAFNLHPFYAAPDVVAAYRTFAFERVDGLMARRLFADPALWASVAVLDDSDRFCFVTLAPESHQPLTTGAPFDLDLETAYARSRRSVGPFNLWQFAHRLTFRWPETARRADAYDPETVRRILAAGARDPTDPDEPL